MLLDDAVVVGVAVEEQQSVLAPQGDTCLVEDTVVESDVLALGLRGDLHNLKGLQLDIVGLGQCHHIGDEHGGTRRETAYGQRALDDALDALLQLETLAEGVLGATGIVAPMMFFHLRRGVHMERHIAFERPRRESDGPVVGHVKPQVNALVDGEARHQSVLVVNMRSQRTYAIGRKDMILIVFHYFFFR